MNKIIAILALLFVAALLVGCNSEGHTAADSRGEYYEDAYHQEADSVDDDTAEDEDELEELDTDGLAEDEDEDFGELI
jgi:hypothetical protein